MNSIEQKQVENIKAKYTAKAPTKLDELKALDKKVRRPAQIFSYVFGSVGALVLGTGMCLAMKVIGNLMPLGIVVGVVGIGMVSVNYYLYKKFLGARKKKHADEIIELSDGILNK